LSSIVADSGRPKIRSSVTIHVPAKTLADARHQQGRNFLSSVCALLNDGYVVEIETTQETRKFRAEIEFLAWFNNIAPAEAA